MNRYRGVSGWAAPFVDEETGEVLEEPKNVTPPFVWLAGRRAECYARMTEHQRTALACVVRACVAFAIVFLGPWHWLRAMGWVGSVVFGAIAVWHSELWLIAKRESNITLDD